MDAISNILFPASQKILNEFGYRFCKVEPHLDNDDSDSLFLSLEFSRCEKRFCNGECLSVSVDRGKYICVDYDTYTDYGTVNHKTICYGVENLQDMMDAVKKFIETL